jgi:hypothetical protein
VSPLELSGEFGSQQSLALDVSCYVVTLIWNDPRLCNIGLCPVPSIADDPWDGPYYVSPTVAVGSLLYNGMHYFEP